jgi:hypothetical protein
MDSRIETRAVNTRSPGDLSHFYGSDLVGLPLLTRAGRSRPFAGEGRLMRSPMQSEWALIAIAAALGRAAVAGRAGPVSLARRR